MHKIFFCNKFIICLYILYILYVSICFEHYVLIIRRSKLYYTAFGITAPVDSRPVHRLKEDSTCARDGHLQIVMIPNAV